MKAFSPILILSLAILGTSSAPAQSPFGAPPSSAASSTSAEANPLEQLLDKFSEGMRKDLIDSLAAYPDDVLAMVFKVAEHPANIVTMRPHETDTEFNRAAATLFSQYPEVFQTLRQNPTSTAAVGQYARRYPQETWQQVDGARVSNKMTLADLQASSSSGSTAHAAQANAATSKAPAAAMPSDPMASLAGKSGELSKVSESIDSTTKQLSGINDNLTGINSEVNNAKNDYKRAKSEYYNVKNEAIATKEKAEDAAPAVAVAAAVGGGRQGSVGSSNSFPFGPGVGGGFGRTGAAASSPTAWQSSALPGPQLQQLMQRNNGQLGMSFGKTEKAFGPQQLNFGGPMGASSGGFPAGPGGGGMPGAGRPGGPAPGGPGGPRR